MHDIHQRSDAPMLPLLSALLITTVPGMFTTVPGMFTSQMGRLLNGSMHPGRRRRTTCDLCEQSQYSAVHAVGVTRQCVEVFLIY